MLRLLQEPELRVMRLISQDGWCRNRLVDGDLVDLSAPPSASDYCDFRNSYEGF